MRRVVTILSAIGIVILVATSAVGFGPWAPYTYWGGSYSSSSGGGYWPGYYSSSCMCMPASSGSFSYWPSSSSYRRVYYSYPSSGMYYWPASSSSSSFKQYYY